MEGYGPNCVRNILLFFNFVFFLSGLLLMATGIWMFVDSSRFEQEEFISKLISTDEEFFRYIQYFFIGAGFLIVLVSLVGCCGALAESKCLLGAYAFLLIIVILIEIGCLVLANIDLNKTEDDFNYKFKTLVQKYFKDGNMSDESIRFQAMVNGIQTNLVCCGYLGYEDYEDIALDTSCCQAETCLITTDNHPGCKEKLAVMIKEKSIHVIFIVIGIACLKIFGLTLSLYLCRIAD